MLAVSACEILRSEMPASRQPVQKIFFSAWTFFSSSICCYFRIAVVFPPIFPHVTPVHLQALSDLRQALSRFDRRDTSSVGLPPHLQCHSPMIYLQPSFRLQTTFLHCLIELKASSTGNHFQIARNRLAVRPGHAGAEGRQRKETAVRNLKDMRSDAHTRGLASY